MILAAFHYHLNVHPSDTADAGVQTLVMRYMPQHNNTNRFGYQPSAELLSRLSPIRRNLLTDLCHPLGVGTRKSGQPSAHSAMKPAGWPAEQVAPVFNPYGNKL